MLEVWEAGLAGAPVSRAVRMLRAAGCADVEAEIDTEVEAEVETLSIGRRDALVLDLRARLFGPRIEAVLPCPACDTELETGFDVSAVRAVAPQPPPELEVRTAGHTARFRLPHTGDLEAIDDGLADPVAARAALLTRCVLDAWDADGARVPAKALPGEVAAAIAAAMERADPQAAACLAVTCPSCGHAWVAPFDVVEFLWRELEAAAERLLTDVHLLATAYGWSEREILALSPARRERYIEMVTP